MKSPSGHYTPLRYPGGKGKISKFLSDIIAESNLHDGFYVEPYAGGAAIAIELLLQEKVQAISLNDLSKDIFAFWYSVINSTDDLCQLISETPLTVDSWDEQKKIHRSGTSDTLALGFATLFLNRTNRSGILNAGIIGGRAQTGVWKIDARYNAVELIRRVRAISRKRTRIAISNMDAVEFIEVHRETWPERTLVYLDPPYYVKGHHLYYHHYRHNDHAAVREAVVRLVRQSWLVSYDDVSEIRSLYAGERFLRYSLGYSARTAGSGAEIMFCSSGLTIPPCCSTMNESERSLCEVAA